MYIATSSSPVTWCTTMVVGWSMRVHRDDGEKVWGEGKGAEERC